MDPVTIGAVLAAIVGGIGGALGTQLWAGVSALISRPFHHPCPDQAKELSSGMAELTALKQAPHDQARAVALAEVLVARSGADPEFGLAFDRWRKQASQLQTGGGDVTNTISDGIFHGSVLQGRDFTGLTVGNWNPPRCDLPPQWPGP